MPTHDIKLPRLLARTTQLAGASICVFLLWAALAQVDEAVKGNGRTVSSGQNKMIQHLEGGIVADINVQEGQLVEKDQVMLRIQNVGMASTLRENTIRQRSLEAAMARLKAEIEETPSSSPRRCRRMCRRRWIMSAGSMRRANRSVWKRCGLCRIRSSRRKARWRS
jgi:multidrug efflux pump subunit AcrA (membrane-fusion protein)